MAVPAADNIEQAASNTALVHPAVRAFFNMAAVWDLGDREQCRLLGGISRRTLYSWRRQPPATVAPDVMRRLSYVLGIHGLLRQLFPNAPLEHMAERVRHAPPATITGGLPLLDFLLEGGVVAMHQARSYLVSEAGSDLVAPSQDHAAQPGSRTTAASRW